MSHLQTQVRRDCRLNVSRGSILWLPQLLMEWHESGVDLTFVADPDQATAYEITPDESRSAADLDDAALPGAGRLGLYSRHGTYGRSHLFTRVTGGDAN